MGTDLHDEPTVAVPTAIQGESRDNRSGSRFTPGTLIGDRYRIVGLIGRGGMGEVYRADDMRLGQPVALKFLPPDLAVSERHRERLYAEVRIGRQIAHPNVCRLYDVDQAEGNHFLAMELVDGEDLASLLRRIGALPQTKAIQIAKEIAAGLAAAHDKGILHRDLKPANVMIDGKGVARITDFGLAAIAEEVERLESAGTPAYMAPEQLDGRGVDFKSDIYALGLIFYEIFTGKRLFDAKSLGDLVDVRRRTDSRSLSHELREIDPVIQRLIIRCLDPDPAVRPDSAHAIAAALPGGDRLQAALDAGETPSPEMVAAAGEIGDLPARYAWPLLAMILLGIVAFVFVIPHSMLYKLVPLEKSPEILAERARELIASFGYPAPPVDSAYQFSARLDAIRLIAVTDQSTDRWKQLATVRPPPIVFDYRQSPRTLVPNRGEARVTPSDPPFDLEGMTAVTLDPKGRLLRFRAVPPDLEDHDAVEQPYDWSVFFDEAGLTSAAMKPARPVRSAPVDTTAKSAWTGVYPDQPNRPIRVEAATYHGRPVWFAVMAEVELAHRTETLIGSSLSGTQDLFTVIVFFAAMGAGALLARRNVRRGRGDRAGARRLAMVVFVTILLGRLIRADHVADLGEEGWILTEITGSALFWTSLTWLLYLAFEPYVRRRWPRMLIGWTRLLAGQWRDPMVGRDLLAGAALGTLLLLMRQRLNIAPTWFGQPPLTPMYDYLSALSEPRHTVFIILLAFYMAIFSALSAVLILFMLRTILRNDRVALVAAVIVFSLLAILEGENLPIELGFLLVSEALVVVLLWRAGLLALTAAFFFGLMPQYVPMTFDPSSWYFGRTLFAFAIVAALAVTSFYRSLGDRPLFGVAMLED